MPDILIAKPAVDNVPIFVHRTQILLNVGCGGSKRGYIWFQIHRETYVLLGAIFKFLFARLPKDFLRFVTSSS